MTFLAGAACCHGDVPGDDRVQFVTFLASILPGFALLLGSAISARGPHLRGLRDWLFEHSSKLPRRFTVGATDSHQRLICPTKRSLVSMSIELSHIVTGVTDRNKTIKSLSLECIKIVLKVMDMLSRLEAANTLSAIDQY